jgi:predicted ATP-binding protein involved in virulence
MKIQKIHLTDFDSFTNIEISDIPKSSKLAILIDSNDSGNYSIFDAFHFKNGSVLYDVFRQMKFFLGCFIWYAK